MQGRCLEVEESANEIEEEKCERKRGRGRREEMKGGEVKSDR